MKLIKAKILDPTHLELGQPIPGQPGEHIVISVPDEKDEDRLWREAAKKHFLAAYDDQDAIYDGLGDLDGIGQANESRAN
ncbi:MAG: hypothetical protein FJ279_24420 [Planctomycetes bacterium]|nr:hypothetical protein [Planctomycetota bacterium]